MLDLIGLNREDFEPIRVAVKERGLEEGIRLVTDRMLDLAVHGTPDECIAKIEELNKKVVTNITLGSPLGTGA